MLLETGGKYLTRIHEGGTVAVVTQTPVASEHLASYLLAAALSGRVSSVHFVYPNDMPEGKRHAPLRDLRAGWERVVRELELVPQATRVLLMGDSNMLRVAVPNLPKHVGIDDAHGTLFQLDERVLVPTFELQQWQHTHVQPWMKRDAARCIQLTRPTMPLPFNYGNLNGVHEADTVVIDLETTGLDSTVDTITTLGVQWSDTDRTLITEHIQDCLGYLADLDIKNYVFHNAQFDLGFVGGEFRAKTYGRVRDTMVRAKSRGELRASLKHLGNTYTARPGNYAWVQEASGFDDPSYVCEDLDTTWRLFRLWPETSPVVELMERAVVMAAEQTALGTAVDTSVLDTLADEGAALVVRLREELTAEYGVDPGQTEALCEVLRDRGYPLSRKTASGRDQLTAEVLEELGLTDVLEFRKAQKLDSAFVGKIRGLVRPDGTIPHTQTMLAARTGRTSMKNYNHQQSGKKGPTKKLLVSRFPGGHILSCDIKQAEVRVAAYLSGDRKLAAALMRADIHRENAARGFGIAPEEVTDDQRFGAKALIFRSIFGGQPQNEIQQRVYTYMRSEFHQLFEWIERQKKLGQRDLRVVDAYGKVINLQDVFDYRGKWACGRVGINGPIQGLSSHLAIEITVRAWELFRETGLRSAVCFGVHDSLVADVAKGETWSAVSCVQQAFRDLRATPAWGLLPLMATLPFEGELQMGRSWADTKNGAVINCTSATLEESACGF
jgi:DNA polymerase I-like protein with 3'-5' exonuclease and polymerase domains